jgi:hypothetical protein
MRFWCYLMEWNMMKLAQLSRTHRRIVSMVQVSCLCHEYFSQPSESLDRGANSRIHALSGCPRSASVLCVCVCK